LIDLRLVSTKTSESLFKLDHPKGLIAIEPYYITHCGAAYVANSLDILRALPDESINAVITSPPYALHFQKEYGNAPKDEYLAWFMPFAQEIQRVLVADGSFVLNIGGSYNPSVPTRSLYHFKLLIALVEHQGFHLAQECFWHNPAKMPMPAEWVTVRRIRIKDSVEYVWWLSKSPWPKANNRRVLKPYSQDMKRLHSRGLKRTKRPSGHNIRPSFSEVAPGGSIPPNVINGINDESPDELLIFGNNASTDIYTRRCKEAGIVAHPARFPSALPEFFIKLLTDEGDLVLDPFAGSNTTGATAEKLERRWIAVDSSETYIKSSQFRFG
jgi:site-specific DNA-methyltransferase (cytosine-N4-specific)